MRHPRPDLSIWEVCAPHFTTTCTPSRTEATSSSVSRIRTHTVSCRAQSNISLKHLRGAASSLTKGLMRTAKWLKHRASAIRTLLTDRARGAISIANMPNSWWRPVGHTTLSTPPKSWMQGAPRQKARVRPSSTTTSPARAFATPLPSLPKRWKGCWRRAPTGPCASKCLRTGLWLWTTLSAATWR